MVRRCGGSQECESDPETGEMQDLRRTCLLDVLDYLNVFDWLWRLIETLRLITQLGFGPEPTQQRERDEKWSARLKLFIRTFLVSCFPARETEGEKTHLGRNTSFLNSLQSCEREHQLYLHSHSEERVRELIQQCVLHRFRSLALEPDQWKGAFFNSFILISSH